MSNLKRRKLLQRGAALSAAAMLGPVGRASAVGIDYDVIIIGDGDPGYHIHQSKAEAAEQAELGVTQAHFRFDRFLQNNQELAVYKIERIDDG